MSSRHLDVKQLTTRELLDYREHAYRFGGQYSPVDSGGPFITLEEILKELDTREHIPNKKEAKLLRRAASQGRK